MESHSPGESQLGAFYIRTLVAIANNTPSRHVTLIDPKLQELADCGIAVHHAGLEYADRRAIETAFREGQLYLIVSTSVSDSCL